MILNKIVPLWLHAICAATSVGLAVGLHSTSGSPILSTYTVTGFAVGMAITTIARAIHDAIAS